MKFRPVANDNKTIVAGAGLSADSALLYMSMIEDKKEFEEILQERREDAFFAGDKFAMDVEYDDIIDSEFVLTHKQAKEIDSMNCGTWKTIFEDCYQWSENREPEHPLGRIKSVSQNVNLPSMPNRLVFDTSNVRVMNIDGEEAIEIHFSDNQSLTVFIDTENMELYNNMYHPPVVADITTLKGMVDEFDELVIRNNSEESIRVMNSFSPDEIKRETTKTEIVLRNDMETKDYIPKSRVIDEDENRRVLDMDINKLRTLPPMPSDETEKILIETLEQGYNTSERSIKLFELVRGKSRGCVSYSYLGKPYYLEEVARLLGKNMIPVPQEEMMILTDEAVPEWLENLNRQFPQKDKLSDEEMNKVMEYIGIPQFIDFSIEWRDMLKSKEILVNMFEDEEVALEDIVSYYVVPWECVRPSKDSVEDAISYGNDIREELRLVDDEYGTDLYNNTVTWEQRKIYRRSNHEL